MFVRNTKLKPRNPLKKPTDAFDALRYSKMALSWIPSAYMIVAVMEVYMASDISVEDVKKATFTKCNR